MHVPNSYYFLIVGRIILFNSPNCVLAQSCSASLWKALKDQRHHCYCSGFSSCSTVCSGYLKIGEKPSLEHCSSVWKPSRTGDLTLILHSLKIKAFSNGVSFYGCCMLWGGWMVFVRALIVRVAATGSWRLASWWCWCSAPWPSAVKNV